jgi:hypothetical protein
VRDSSTSLNVSILRFNATNGTFVDRLPLGRDGWSFDLGRGNIVYDSNDERGGFVDRIGPSSIAAFTVSLDAASASPVTVDFHTANGTAQAGRDYLPAAGTITIPPGLTAQTVFIQTLEDCDGDATGTFSVDLSHMVGAVLSRSQGIGTILDDDSTDEGHSYAAADSRTSGSANASSKSGLAGNNTNPQGIADLPADMLLTPAGSSLPLNHLPTSLFNPAGFSQEPSGGAAAASHDAVFALLVGEPLPGHGVAPVDLLAGGASTPHPESADVPALLRPLTQSLAKARFTVSDSERSAWAAAARTKPRRTTAAADGPGPLALDANQRQKGRNWREKTATGGEQRMGHQYGPVNQ